jgi:phosphatidylglycerophosphate synthase
MFDGRFKTQIERYVRPVGESLRRTGLSPDHFTLLGLCVAAASAVAIGTGKMQLGLLLVICSALPDLLDGALAKASNSASQRGAFFDSVVDRVSDSFLFGGVAWFYASSDTPQFSIVPFAILGASLIISYERAKAESLGFMPAPIRRSFPLFRLPSLAHRSSFLMSAQKLNRLVCTPRAGLWNEQNESFCCALACCSIRC